MKPDTYPLILLKNIMGSSEMSDSLKDYSYKEVRITIHEVVTAEPLRALGAGYKS